MYKPVLFLFCIALLTTPVLATDYVAKFTVDKVESVNGVNTWSSSQTFTLNKTESKNYLDIVTINFFDIDSSVNPIQIVIKTTGTETTSFSMTSGEIKNIKGKYTDNASQASIGDIRIKLNSLTALTAATINTSSDNPVYAYFYTDKEWSLRKDDSVTFDAKAQKTSVDSGVTYAGNTAVKEIYVYFKRLQPVPISVTVSSKDEPPSVWDNEKLKYTITKSDTYIFTIKYSITNPWGASSDTTNKYTFVAKGLEDSSTIPVFSTAAYDVFVGDTKTIPMSEAGSFSQPSGTSISQISNNTYAIRFDVAGNYNLVYNSVSGIQTGINFNVIPKSSSTPQAQTAQQPEAQATVNANQQQLQNGNTLGIDNKYIGLGIVALVVGIILVKRKKGGNGGYNQYQARKNV